MHHRWWPPDFWTVKTSWLENGPWMKMYFLVKIGKFQPAMLVYWRVVRFWPRLWVFSTCVLFLLLFQAMSRFHWISVFPGLKPQKQHLFCLSFLGAILGFFVPYTRTDTLDLLFFFDEFLPLKVLNLEFRGPKFCRFSFLLDPTWGFA